VPKILLDWWLYVACYYPTTPTDYPSNTRGMSVGPPIAVNIDFCGYLRFWALILSELYGYNTPLTTFLVNKLSLLHRPVLIFQPTVNCRASDNQGELFLEQYFSLKELYSCVSTYESGYLEGFRRWGGWSILATQSCSLPKHCRISDRSEQNSTKLQHTVGDIFRHRLTI
jgi:hypothetical protein